jgi:hypothetical protein
MPSHDEIRAVMLKTLYDHEMSSPLSFYNSGNFLDIFQEVPRIELVSHQLYLIEKGLSQGFGIMGRVTSRKMRITSKGIDVVEHPEKFTDLSIDPPILKGLTKPETTTSLDSITNIINTKSDIDAKTKELIKTRLEALSDELSKDAISKSKIKELTTDLKKYQWLNKYILELIRKNFNLE